MVGANSNRIETHASQVYMTEGNDDIRIDLSEIKETLGDMSFFQQEDLSIRRYLRWKLFGYVIPKALTLTFNPEREMETLEKYIKATPSCKTKEDLCRGQYD